MLKSDCVLIQGSQWPLSGGFLSRGHSQCPGVQIMYACPGVQSTVVQGSQSNTSRGSRYACPRATVNVQGFNVCLSRGSKYACPEVTVKYVQGFKVCLSKGHSQCPGVQGMLVQGPQSMSGGSKYACPGVTIAVHASGDQQFVLRSKFHLSRRRCAPTEVSRGNSY